MRRIVLMLCIIILVVTCNNLMAQDDKTSYDRSRKISDQLKNGTAPGLKFGPTAKKKTRLIEPSQADKSVSVGQQLKNGNMPGTPVARGGGNSRPFNTNARKSSAAAGKLPSESAAGTDIKSSPATIQPPKPDQGGVKEVLTAPVPANARRANPDKPVDASDKKQQPVKE